MTTTPVFGQSVALTATVAASGTATGTPTGTVQFDLGSVNLGSATLNSSGVATLDTTSLATGSNSITAIYSGDTNYATSTSSAVTVTVAQASSTTTVTASPNPSVAGQTVTLTATVAAVSPGSGTATGTVTFFNGTASLGTGTLSDGVATFTTTTLAVGTNSITAVYAGDTNFTTSTSAAVSQVVKSGDRHGRGHDLELQPVRSPGGDVDGHPHRDLRDGTPTGSVTFYDHQGPIWAPAP